MREDTQKALKELAEPRPGGDLTKSAIDRAARKAGLTYWRAFDIWYGKARRIEDSEHAAITAALQKKRNEATNNELHELRIRLARLEARVAAEDADYRREVPDRMRAAFG